jgi:hypothetical protein
VGRQVPSALLPGFERLFSFNWPSVPYALDILAWDYCFGLALLLAAPVFTRRPRGASCPHGLDPGRCAVPGGAFGRGHGQHADPQRRHHRLWGGFPVVTLLIARLFARTRAGSGTTNRAEVGA